MSGRAMLRIVMSMVMTNMLVVSTAVASHRRERVSLSRSGAAGSRGAITLQSTTRAPIALRTQPAPGSEPGAAKKAAAPESASDDVPALSPRLAPFSEEAAAEHEEHSGHDHRPHEDVGGQHQGSHTVTSVVSVVSWASRVSKSPTCLRMSAKLKLAPERQE